MKRRLQDIETKALVGIPLPTSWYQGWKRKVDIEAETVDKHEKTEPPATPPGQPVSDTTATPPSTFPELHFTYSRTKLLLYVCFLLLCNVIIPIILFYPLVSRKFTFQCAHFFQDVLSQHSLPVVTSLSTQGVVGISSAALGISSCFDTPLRLYRRMSCLLFYAFFRL
jgi:hypothetical protein